jgi:hypothetical protein
MILTRSTSLVTVSLFCLVAMPASGAWGATKKKTPVRPTVRSVAPMKAGVGDQLTIKGRNFQVGKNRNTVFFKAGSKPAVTAKAVQSTRTTMKVVVPKGLEKYILVKDGVAQPTRFRLRVLSKRFAKDYTAFASSPTITLGNAPGSGFGAGSGPAADCDADGIVNSVDADDDNDLLSDALDIALKLNPCSADTDGDGVEDGFEYQSALDLNSAGGALPYPGKRPYPNPLDGTDGATDYDGDGLSARQEQALWKTFSAPTLLLSYSAGIRATVPGQPNDGERDADGDLLGNWNEFNGAMQPGWWLGIYKEEKPYTEPYDPTSAIDPDSDGDGLIDGLDDSDHDGWLNVEEISRGNLVTHDGATHYYRVHPFNPCLPDYLTSPTCSVHPPPPDLSYPPFDAALPPSPIVLGP